MDYLKRQNQTTCFMLGRPEKERAKPVVVRGPLVLGEDYLRDDEPLIFPDRELITMPEATDEEQMEEEQGLRYAMLELLEILEEEHDSHCDNYYVGVKRDDHGHRSIYNHIVENLVKLFEVYAEALSSRGAHRASIARAQDRARHGWGWCRRLSSGAWKRGCAIILDRWGRGGGGAGSK